VVSNHKALSRTGSLDPGMLLIVPQANRLQQKAPSQHVLVKNAVRALLKNAKKPMGEKGSSSSSKEGTRSRALPQRSGE